jgi:hypothetical protein
VLGRIDLPPWIFQAFVDRRAHIVNGRHRCILPRVIVIPTETSYQVVVVLEVLAFGVNVVITWKRSATFLAYKVIHKVRSLVPTRMQSVHVVSLRQS